MTRLCEGPSVVSGWLSVVRSCQGAAGWKVDIGNHYRLGHVVTLVTVTARTSS